MAELNPDQAIEQLRKLPEDKQRLVLGKLSPDVRKSILAKIQSSGDFTSNPKGEGIYRMLPSSNEGFTNTSDEIQVPYSRVQDALGAGMHLHPDEEPRYSKDSAHEGEGPTLKERAQTYIENKLQPVKDPASFPPILAPALPFTNTNQMRAAGSVFYSMPEYLEEVASAWNALRKGEDPTGSRLLDLTDPGKMGESLQKKYQEDYKKDPKMAVDNLYGTIIGMSTLGAVTHGAGEVFKVPTELKSKLKERIRTGLQEKFGGGHDFVKKKVEEFRAANERARTGIQAADEVTEVKRGAVDEVNQDRQDAHGEKLKEHGEKVKADAEKHAEKMSAWEKKRADVLKKHQDDTKDVQADNVKLQQDHIAKVEQIARDKEAAQGIDSQRQVVKQSVEMRSRELQQRINKAEIDAKDADDKAWAAWRKKTGNAQADMGSVVDKINEQEKRMNPDEQREFRDILEETKPDKGDENALIDIRDKLVKDNGYTKHYNQLAPLEKADIDRAMKEMAETGELGQLGTIAQGGIKEVPLERLHGWKTQLERAIRRAQSGNVKYAVGQVLQAIRGLEETVSAQYNAGAELKAARALHGPFVETFIDSPNEAPTAASTFLKQVTPDFAKADRLAEFGKQLGAYDPEIPKLAEALEKDQETLKKLPSEAEVRKLMSQEVPTPPTPKPLPPEPEIDPAPKVPPPRKPPKTPSVKPYPEPKGRPSVPAAEDFTPERREELLKNIKKFGATGQWAWRLILGTSGEIALGLLGGNNPTAGVGKFGSGLIIGQGLMRLFSNVLRHDTILDWMAHPSAEDLSALDSLPPRDAERLRTAIKGLRDEETKKVPTPKGYKVSPAVATFLAGGAASQKKESPADLLKQAQEYKPQAAASGPQSSVKPNYTHMYDPESDSIVAVQ